MHLRRVVVGIASMLVTVLSAQSAELPVPCAGGSCGPTGPATWVSSGAATAALSGNALAVNQTSNSAVLNWQSFNISADGRVDFSQPDASAVAVNRIFQADPSRIFGALNANGRIFLINQNGILFGEGARVNVGGLVASALNITPEALRDGIALAAQSGRPAFEQFRDANGNALPSGGVNIAPGATIDSAGGQVLVFAPQIDNRGTIRTPDGQTILAAGDSVFLLSSSDPALRGLLVEVGVGGTVTNGAAANAGIADAEQQVGQLIAERGNVTLAGLAVNQLGRVSATTSVRSNGSVRLLARDQGRVEFLAGGAVTIGATRGGELAVGERSSTSVLLDPNNTDTQVDVNAQVPSFVELEGARVDVRAGARVTATSGDITVTARSNPQNSPDAFAPESDGSRIHVASGATLDVSGATVDLPMERNIVRVELRGNELRDSPEQREGPLRGQAVLVDIRRSGVRSDGTAWQGTPLADVSGAIATVGRSVAERSTSGGSIALRSQGDVLLTSGSVLDVSGGRINYASGYLNTSQLLGVDGRTYDISSADPRRSYISVLNSVTVEHPRWGVSEVFPGLYGDGRGRFELGYVEGSDAGSVAVLAPRAVLDGDIEGRLAIGQFQRQPTQTLGARQVRPFDQLPARAQLTLGNRSAASAALPNYVLGDVTFGTGAILAGLRNDDGSPFDPLRDSLPGNVRSTRVRSGLLSEFGPGRLEVFSNGSVRLDESVALDLGIGAELSLTGGLVDLSGDVSAAGGTITLRSQPTLTTSPEDSSVQVGATASLDLRGRWINDNPVLARTGAAPAPVVINGGSVRVTAQQGSAVLERGSLIDVSAGAWQRADGQIAPGRGGDVSVAVTPATELANPVSLELGSELRSLALFQGGRLSVTANDVCISPTDCRDGEESRVWLAPEVFEQSGFGSFAIASNRGGVSIAPGAVISLRQRNLEFVTDTTLRETGSDLAAFTRAATLDSLARRPANLALSSTVTQGIAPFTPVAFADAPGLTIGSGAAIIGDPGAQIALRSNTRIIIDGQITAPSGTIEVDLSSNLPVTAFLPSQGIWLGSSARLDASAATRITTNDRGLMQGQVLDGGTVSLRAQRGYLIALPGSVIDVSGTAADLDIRQGPLGATTQRERIASDGGRISLSAAEGILTSGTLNARAGDGPFAAGGELSVVLDAGARIDPGQIQPLFPTTTRRIVVSQSGSPLVIAPGTDVPATLNGSALIAADDIERGGFDSLNLTARNLFGLSNTVLSTGEIRFDGPVNLALGRELNLSAAAFAAPFGTVSLSAPYVSLGSTDRLSQLTPSTLMSGDASLLVSANAIELIGNSVLQGFGNATLRSDGDIRLRGVQLLDSRQIAGSFVSPGDLTFDADQIYPTTLSQFELAVRDNADGSIFVRSSSTNDSDAVLSAGGRLRLSAPNIAHSGVLRAPFGTITFAAERLVLNDGSLTSTSAENLLIPFGSTQGGFDWVYELEDQQTLVFGPGQNAPPAQRVALEADEIDIREGATIDLSGGGDLLAYEFVPGVGGSRDVLSPTVRPNQFAIVPGLTLGYAPFDQREYRGSSLSPGDSVYLAGIAGVPEGAYALLPARYALLPGAFLVSAVGGYQDILPGEQYRLLDGSTVVAGYRTTAGTDFRAARTSGFAVIEGSAARREAQYDAARAGEFFASQAAAAEVARPRLPGDAGTLALIAGQSLALQGSLLANAVAGGRGAAVDISGARLRVVDSVSGPSDGSEVLLLDESLSRLGAASLLLGGTRAFTDEGLFINVSADQVTLAGGTSVNAPEVILAASGTVALESGATLSAVGTTQGAQDDRLLLAGDGALLRVSSGEQAQIERSQSAGAAGTLRIDAGARLTTRQGSVLLDASRDMRSDGLLDIAGSSLNLGASLISLGAVPDITTGLIIDSAELEALGLNELVLSSRSTVDLYGDASLNVNRLAIAASGVRAVGEGVRAQLGAADRITLTNPTALELAGGGSDGVVELSGARIELDSGRFGLSGFDSVVLRSSGDLTGVGDGALAVDGDLSIFAGRITSLSGIVRELSASRNLDIGRSTPAGAAVATVVDGPELGGRLSLSAERVTHAGTIELRSGVVSLSATGSGANDDVLLADGALVDVSGVASIFDGVPVSATAGSISLTANNGGVRLAAGSVLNVSGAAEGGDAGSIAVSAAVGDARLDGGIAGGALAGFDGGSISIDALSVGELGALTRSFGVGGFTRSIGVRQRGDGDLIVAAGPDSAIRSREVTLVAERGSVHLMGTIDARGESGGRVLLAARDDVRVDGAITASATAAGGRGGNVALQSAQGAVHLASGSTVDVRNGATVDPDAPRGGELNIRLLRTSVLSVLDADAANDQLSLAGQILGAAGTLVEGFAVYDAPTGSISDANVVANTGNPWFAEATDFMLNAPAVRAAVQRQDDPAFSLRPGIEVRSATDLSLDANWNLFNWRFADLPGVLTLRAGGTLTFNQSLSDGFAGITGSTAFLLPTTPSESWSYRLIGGSDLASVDTLATARRIDLAPGSGDVRIAEGGISADPVFEASDFRMVRTGTGDIDVRAAGDFTLGNRASVLYTAGAAGPGIRLTGIAGLGGRVYPVNGGDISIAAQGNIRGAPTNQLVTDWLWRVGNVVGSDALTPVATAWTVNFRRFEQGIGALGGGNISIAAGQDIELLSASIPSIGRQVGGTRPADSVVEVVAGGNLDVRSGGSIRGGSFYVGLGNGSLHANDSITSAATPTDLGIFELAPVLALGDARFTLEGRRDVTIETAVTPTWLPQAASQNVLDTSYFSTYAPGSAIELKAVAGTARLRNEPADLQQALTSIVFGTETETGLKVYPPTLRVSALRGDVDIASSFTLFPAPKGNLELFAWNDVLAGTSGGAEIFMSDADPRFLPRIEAPQTSFTRVAEVLRTPITGSPNLFADVPVHADANQPDGIADRDPVRVVALNGSIVLAPQDLSDQSGFYLAKPARLVAGGDIRDVTLVAQNLRPSDITSLIAGGDLSYSILRTPQGSIVTNDRELSVDGPGHVELTAGGDVDFQTAGGVSTRGNLRNPALAETGASISITAGLGPRTPAFDEFIDEYLQVGGIYDQALVNYVSLQTGTPLLSAQQALPLFKELTRSQQAPFLERVLFSELRASGRAAAASGSGDFSRAFAALETLFPGSNPDVDAGETNPYRGDVNLFFSRVYTLDGGDISLLAPGGEINVGLATPPAALGVSKEPSDLGLVAQGTGTVNSFSYLDFLVNESRVFAADGGSILVWSTRGDIDAGRGAKTAISAPPPTITFDPNGNPRVNFPPALTGSGIQTLASTPGRKPGDVDLFAPRGVVNAGDAGIVAGNLTIAATAVLGANNISVSGASVGVPVDTGGLGAALSGVSNVASSASSAATATVAEGARRDGQGDAPLSESALGWLEVFVLGFGEEVCKDDDIECLKRNQQN